MKFLHIFAIVVACNAIALFSRHRGIQSACAVISMALAIYGIAKLV